MRLIDGHRTATPMRALSLGMGGCTLSLRTESARIEQLATEFFPAGGLDNTRLPHATVTMIVGKRRDIHLGNCIFPIFRGRNEYVHADYGRDGSVWFDLKARAVSAIVSDRLLEDADIFNRTVLAVIAGTLAPSLGLLGIHAGCVVRNGNAVLLAAKSGVGKSTLTLALALRGWSLLSDDWTFIAGSPTGLRAWGMRTSIKLMPDAVRYFPELESAKTAASLNGEMSFEVDPWTFFHVDRAIQATPVSMILLERKFEVDCEPRHFIRQCGAEEMQAALLQDIEEQPSEIDGASRSQLELIEQLCALPGFKVRVNGDPAMIAAGLDHILTPLTEQACA
jgi:hypothetical protein